MESPLQALSDAISRLVNRYPLRRVLLGSFAVIVLFALASVMATDLVARSRITSAERIITSESQISDLCLKSRTAMVNARRFEKDFLLSRDEFGHPEAVSRYITRVRTNLSDLRDHMASVRALTNDPAIAARTRTVEEAVGLYEGRLGALVEKYGLLGNSNRGLEGVIVRQAREIERLLGPASPPQIRADLLDVRRHEKNFIMRSLDASVVELHAAAGRFQSGIAASGLSADVAGRIRRLIASYLKDFDTYVRTVEDIRTIRADSLKAVQSVEPVLEQLYAGSLARFEAARKLMERIQYLSGLVKTVFGLLTILLLLSAAYIISLAISRSVEDGTSFARRIAQGDLSGQPAPAGGSELAGLAVSLNTMASSLRQAAAAQELWISRLRESENRFRKIFEEGPFGMIITDSGGAILRANQASCRLLGHTEIELVGHPLARLVHPDERDAVAAGLRDVLAGTTSRLGRELRYIRKDDNAMLAQVTATAIESGDGRAVYGLVMIEDISEHRRLEEQLREAQKLEVLGRLTGGISHEFNNVLQSIIGYGELLEDSLPKGDRLRSYVDVIMSSAFKAAHLTQGLLAYSRKQIMRKEAVPLQDILRKVRDFLSRSIGEDISLMVSMPEALLVVHADRNQIEQALMNLATNAKDAMPDGGTLAIGLAAFEADEEFVRTHGSGAPGPHALITIADNGVGMDAQVMRHIFEPFFTTKDVGKGTGLGLSVVFGIVRAHDGLIDVESEPGRGTTFSIYLPLVPAGLAGTSAEAPAMHAPVSVLVAEDDAAIRQMIASLLEKNGCAVITAADGEDAVRKLRDHGGMIQLLLCDVVMPRRNGREVHEEALRVNPRIRTVFISGYASDIIADKMPPGDVTFIAKPVSPRELLESIRKVLAAP